MANSTQQRETVVGVFSTRESAQQAIQDLRAAGFDADSIGVLMQNKDDAADLASETGTKAGEAAGVGATTGGVLGALGGLLVGLGALAIPGIGPVLAAGPLVAALGPIIGGTLTGAAIGAGTGALAGALVGLGIPEEEAAFYEQRFNQGGILVTVRSGAARYQDALSILRNAGAEGVESGAQAAAEYGTSSSTVSTSTQDYSQSGGYVQTGGTTQTSDYSARTANTTSSAQVGTTTDADVVRVPVVEETLTANKQAQQAGEVAIRKNVVEEQVSIPVELRHEEVTVTRHVVDRPVQAGEAVLQDGDVIRVPIHEETVDVQKEARVTGEVEIRKQVVAEQHNVSDTVRHEVVDVDTLGEVEARNQAGQTGYTETHTSTTRTSTDNN